MSFFQKETLENKKGWTAAAVVVGAGVVVYVAYKYYKDNLKGGQTGVGENEKNAEETFKRPPNPQESISKSFDKLEDLSIASTKAATKTDTKTDIDTKKGMQRDTENTDSFIVLPKDLSNLPDPSKQLEEVGEKISEGAKNVGEKLEGYRGDAAQSMDAGVKAVNKSIDGFKQDVDKGVKDVSDQMKNAQNDASDKVKEGAKAAAEAVKDFKEDANDKIHEAAKNTSDSLYGMADEAHKKLDEGASDLSKY